MRPQTIEQGQRKTRPKLTRREEQIVKLRAEGWAAKQIAGELGISMKMVEWHVGHIYRRLRFNGIALLTQWALKNGIANWVV